MLYFFTGLKNDHNCWVPLSPNYTELLEKCANKFKALMSDIKSLAWNVRGLNVVEQKNFLPNKC